MKFFSPTFGQLNEEEVKEKISAFMAVDKKAHYRVIVGSDSQRIKKGSYDFVCALVIHRVGSGGIYFWKREIVNKKMSLKERIYQEAIISLQSAETFFKFFKTNGIARYNMEIHVDIGKIGETREMITEVIGMIRGSGYEVKIKPDSFGASKVADRHT